MKDERRATQQTMNEGVTNNLLLRQCLGGEAGGDEGVGGGREHLRQRRRRSAVEVLAHESFRVVDHSAREVLHSEVTLTRRCAIHLKGKREK